MKRKYESKGRYVYYQPNDKDKNNQFGDCTIRALSKALGVTWIEAFDRTIPICRKYQTANVFDVSAHVRKIFLGELGFIYHGLLIKKGQKRQTVDAFAKSHPKGSYILNIAGHVVACVDGKYYDTWDCGYRPIYGYFERSAMSMMDMIHRANPEIISEDDAPDWDGGHIWEIRAYGAVVFRIKQSGTSSLLYVMQEDDGSLYFSTVDIKDTEIKDFLAALNDLSSSELEEFLAGIKTR